MPTATETAALTVIIPSAHPERHLSRILERLCGDSAACEIIVVVDAVEMPGPPPFTTPRLRWLCTGARSGPARARNLGATAAQGNILLFLDDDTIPAAGLAARVCDFFAAHPHAAAVFGSYDDSPAAPGLVSQFKNLQHHFVHHRGAGVATTFWAGCGAIRREVFLAVGGFDTAFEQPSIEDIELGLRLHDQGHTVLLEPSLQVKHLKHWTLRSLLTTDHFCRALPWSRMLLARRSLPRQLNLGWRHRAGVAAAVAACPILLVAPLYPPLVWPALALILLSATCQAEFLRFLLRARGPIFAAASSALILLYHLNAGLAFLRAAAEFPFQSRRPSPAAVPASQ